MCGRYTLGNPPAHPWLRDAPSNLLRPRYNIAPGQDIAVIGRNREGDHYATAARWGFRPRWLATGRRAPINARAETAATTPMYRQTFRKGRCLVPADGWYEWQDTGPGPKQPWYLSLPGRAPFQFAGLATRDGEDHLRVAIVTTEADPGIRPIHHRMPLVLPDDKTALRWLDPETPDAGLAELMGPFAGIDAHPVSRRVNRPDHDEPGLIEPVEPDRGVT